MLFSTINFGTKMILFLWDVWSQNVNDEFEYINMTFSEMLNMKHANVLNVLP